MPPSGAGPAGAQGAPGVAAIGWIPWGGPALGLLARSKSPGGHHRAERARAAGAPVAGDTWPCTLGYVGNSQGIYRATLVYALSLTAWARYSARIVAETGAGAPDQPGG